MGANTNTNIPIPTAPPEAQKVGFRPLTEVEKAKVEKAKAEKKLAKVRQEIDRRKAEIARREQEVLESGAFAGLMDALDSGTTTIDNHVVNLNEGDDEAEYVDNDGGYLDSEHPEPGQDRDEAKHSRQMAALRKANEKSLATCYGSDEAAKRSHVDPMDKNPWGPDAANTKRGSVVAGAGRETDKLSKNS